MPSRVIRAEIVASASLSRVSLGADLTFRNLLLVCDDFGRFDGRLPVLRAALFPTRLDQITESQLTEWLGELVNAGCVAYFHRSNRPYLRLPNWERHRSKSKRADKSRFPEPPELPVADPELPWELNATAQILVDSGDPGDQGDPGSPNIPARLSGDACRVTRVASGAPPPSGRPARKGGNDKTRVWESSYAIVHRREYKLTRKEAIQLSEIARAVPRGTEFEPLVLAYLRIRGDSFVENGGWSVSGFTQRWRRLVGSGPVELTDEDRERILKERDEKVRAGNAPSPWEGDE